MGGKKKGEEKDKEAQRLAAKNSFYAKTARKRKTVQ